MFKQININELKVNPFNLIGKEWLLISATDGNKCNTMTASWGGLGVIWNKNVATVYIRPQRYTKHFVDSSETFTLSFFDESYKKALTYLGRVSGKDEDKIKNVDFHVVNKDQSVYFEEAKMVLVCKKLYHAPIVSEGFEHEETVNKNYPDRDFHEMYIGEIVEVLVKE